MKELKGWVLALVICLFVWFAGALTGILLGTDNIRTEAIEHGVAEWRIDSKTGVISFHWLGDD